MKLKLNAEELLRLRVKGRIVDGSAAALEPAADRGAKFEDDKEVTGDDSECREVSRRRESDLQVRDNCIRM